MRPPTAMACVLFILGVHTTSFAVDLFDSHRHKSCVPDCIRKYCCDDYCPKAEPWVCAPLRFCCDDYCAKQQPRICAPLNFCCDDYCSKCPPSLCCSPLWQNLQCTPMRNCSSPGCTSCDAYAAAKESKSQPVVARSSASKDKDRSRKNIIRQASGRVQDLMLKIKR